MMCRRLGSRFDDSMGVAIDWRADPDGGAREPVGVFCGDLH